MSEETAVIDMLRALNMSAEHGNAAMILACSLVDVLAAGQQKLLEKYSKQEVHDITCAALAVTLAGLHAKQVKQ